MILPGWKLLQIVPQGASVDLHSVDGKPQGVIEYESLVDLVKAGVVAGRGTPSKIKWVELTVDQDEVVRALGAVERRQSRERPQMPLDLLTRMCSARKTIRLIRKATKDRLRRAFLARWYEHKSGSSSSSREPPADSN